MKKIITFLVILTTSILSAQAPQKMSYQAVLRNTSNALITNATVGMRISILQGSATGTAVYVETQNPTTNANGLVSLEIGGGTPVTGTFAGINWANGPFFIKTETDPTGGVNYSITGTTQLLSVPYALYAQSSKQQGKTTIILANDITDAQAAAQIAQELGPNTENIIIQNTSQLTTVDFSAALSLISISINNNAALTSVNFNSLTKLYGSLGVDGNTNLASLSLNNLTESQSVTISNNPNINSISLSNLMKIYGDINISSNNNLQLISFPNLTYLNYFSNIDISYNTNLTNVSFPNFISSIGSLSIEYNNNLNTIILNLTSIQLNLVIQNNALLSSVSFPNLISVYNNTDSKIIISSNSNLSNISLPNLTSCYNLDLSNNLLTSLNISSLSSFGESVSGSEARFSGNILPSSMINYILHKFLTVNPLSGKSIFTNNQSPLAPPTGQGLIDKTTLINTGNSALTD